MTKTETHTNKTILRVLFAGVAVLLFCGAAVGAVGAAGSWSEGVFTPDQTDGYKTGENLATLAAELNNGQPDTAVVSGLTLTLKKDVKLGGTLKIGSATENNPIILDLGGNVLSMNTGVTASVITLDANHKYLKLQDTYTGSADHYFQVQESGPWTWIESPSADQKADAIALAAIKKASELTSNLIIKVPGGCITGGTGTTDGYTYGGGVHVDTGTLTMTGGNIVGNTATNGGGVFVKGGTFEMSDSASIVGNTAQYNGGGVFVKEGSTFEMSDSARVVGNSVPGSASSPGSGGGVYVNTGTFTMSDTASIAGNTAGKGGGVYITNYQCKFTMSDTASITGNTASSDGGGVYIFVYSEFEMSDSSSITNNTAMNGGGVFVIGKISGSTWVYGTFTMVNGTISENEAVGEEETGNYGYGGGVFVGGSFEIIGGTITNNTAFKHSLDKFGRGGGVFVEDKATFKVSGSPKIIDNKDSTDADNNVVLDDVNDDVEGEDEEGLYLTGDFDGEIRITAVGDDEEDPQQPVAGEQFGIVLSGSTPSGAENFKADGTNLFGSIDGAKLVWKVPSSGSSSSSKSQGTSIWLTAEPTVPPTPTPTATAAPTPDVPQVKPVTPTGTPAKTPVPFLGVLAGLGAAAAVFGLRRK